MLTKDIIELLKQTPNQTSNEIAATLNKKQNTVKSTLTKLAKENRVVRERSSVPDHKAGPKSQYVYAAV